MIDVGRDDGPTAGDFGADEFGGDEIRDAGAEGFAPKLACGGLGVGWGVTLAAEVFADGDVFHLRRDDALARVVQLGDDLAWPGTKRPGERGMRNAERRVLAVARLVRRLNLHNITAG